MPAFTTHNPRPSQAQLGRSRSDVSLMRDKNGCITCRVRQKKCSGVEPGRSECTDCLRLNIQCLGVQHNRPDWLRNADALKETKHRIKHHLTEYPVPRGRGPAPERPYLNFNDLIQKYSPKIPLPDAPITPTEDFKNLSIISERLYRMEPDSPTHTGKYLTVQHHAYTPGTPSPSSSYAPMPRTPTSTDGSLFISPDIHACYPNSMLPQGGYMPQTGSHTSAPAPRQQYLPGHNAAGTAYHEIPYVPQLEMYDGMMSVSPTSPYRNGYPEDLFLTSPISPFSDSYLPDHHASPSVRRR